MPSLTLVRPGILLAGESNLIDLSATDQIRADHQLLVKLRKLLRLSDDRVDHRLEEDALWKRCPAGPVNVLKQGVKAIVRG